MVAIAGFDVPDGVFERCQVWRRKVPSEHWRRRLSRMPLSLRMEWAFTVDALEPYLGLGRAERLAFRSVEPEPAARVVRR